MSNVVAIVQARMSSSRMPGKVLADLHGRPVLWHVIHRLQKCSHVDDIIVATTRSPIDDGLEFFVRALGVKILRGSEDNVLLRFVLAAESANADIIVRVTGDVPLVDWEAIDYWIQYLQSVGVDYCMANPRVPTINEGFDVFTAKALHKLWGVAGDDAIAREHVTAYFKLHPDFVDILSVPVPRWQQIPGVKLSVDTIDDLTFLRRMYCALNVAPGEAIMREVAAKLREKPELREYGKSLIGRDCNA